MTSPHSNLLWGRMVSCAPVGNRRCRANESGYALLLVLSMSAIVAIGLYSQLPRAAFEAQREKESLLINHGEQYRRAIQLYCRKMSRYPQKMEDLDNTQNIRFLRKHYIDPMTGKEEWRLLHMGPAGKLIDSKIETTKKDDQWHAGSITEFKSAASSDLGGPEATNLAARKRRSDDQEMGPIGGGVLPGGNTDPGALAMNSTPNGPIAATGASGATGIPGAPPPVPSWVNGGALPGMPSGMRGLTAPTGTPNLPPSAAGNPNGPGSSISGNGGYAATSTPPAGGYPVSSNFGGQSPSPYSTAPGSNQPNNGFGTNGANMSPDQQALAARNVINSLLTSPRPGGPPAGINGAGVAGITAGGLAGVASTFKGRGIKRYADQEEYQKWEFYYDFGGEMTGAGSKTGASLAPNGAPNNSTNGTGFGSLNNTSTFGNTGSGFGNSGFGANGGAVPVPGGGFAPPK